MKCVVVGDESVGKSTLIQTLLDEKPRRIVPRSTVFDYFSTQVEIAKTAGKVDVDVFDTGGNSGLYRIRALAYPSTDVFLVCFSVVNPYSYENVKTRWVPEIRRFRPHTPFLIVGTQSDLRDDHGTLKTLNRDQLKPVPTHLGIQLANELGAECYIECCSLNKEQIDKLFCEAALSVRPVKKHRKFFCV